METSQILQDLQEELLKINQQTGQIYLNEWKNQAQTLLARGKLLQREYEKMNSFNLLTVNDNMLNKILNNNHDFKTENLIKDMYIFLNKVGETLRRKEIKYSITLTTSGPKKQQKMVTYELSLEDFLTVTQSTHTRLTLKKTQTILNQLKNQGIVGYEWSDDEISDFQNFRKNAKRVQGKRWGKVNKGNFLEAYFRYKDNKNNKSYTTTQAMLETMSNTGGFWTGGDYEDFQIKGNSASVTNIYTCMNQIEKIYNTLNLLKITEDGLNVKQEGELNNNMQTLLNNTVDSVLAEIAKQFNVK